MYAILVYAIWLSLAEVRHTASEFHSMEESIAQIVDPRTVRGSGCGSNRGDIIRWRQNGSGMNLDVVGHCDQQRPQVHSPSERCYL